jgi:branched-chain amino acid transport system substrate-binding protein
VGTQIALEAIRIAGTTDPVKINEAIPTIDMPSINQRVKFNKEQHFNRIPLFYGQWFKTDTPEKWEMKITLSKHDFLPAEAEPIFPIP